MFESETNSADHFDFKQIARHNKLRSKHGAGYFTSG